MYHGMYYTYACIWSLLIGVEPKTFHGYELNRWAEEYLG